jgi:hypothetical protein
MVFALLYKFFFFFFHCIFIFSNQFALEAVQAGVLINHLFVYAVGEIQLLGIIQR